MKATHKCPKCDEVGEVTYDYWNFICRFCGYKTHLLMRRELMDMADPTERELVLLIRKECLLT
ncbi:MAG: hypothetical protein V1845_02355 [bacterium]